MNLASIRIITTQVRQLVEFYEYVTGQSFTFYTEDFAELRTASGALAIGSTRTLELFGGQAVASAASNRSVIIEFYVDDVDERYQQLTDIAHKDIVQPPTTMPWGNRSLLFRDPDGNLVNFFTPVSDEAKKRFSKQA
ncbi:putative glyoxalase superfamily protein PhnB [Chitinophaga terrae (ex Kim and Jung 2007)]|uniref:VOC family protein n=1 Tax=Chitinophaga terrae (ex Kim and Jung 2007) TaxID=408074 RepID=UPI0027898E61|nr:VOC family protein [Chitinophaga terrae (ex Kim and Jung 2007)]MDQ0107053.1 putative glyoxalase superfamily protein PhnB [Chitinophaga terrae (ex Kim and Jung 2007)]